jgi:DNA polymerase-3 subunit epsilon
MIPGVSLPPAETHLTERARVLLSAGPADVVALVEYVCQLPGAPRAVAEHLAAVLFSGRSEFARDAGGRWALAPSGAAVHADPPCPPGDDCMRRPYIVVDVETTGGRPDNGDRITEIAAVVVRDGKVSEVFETLVNPQRSIPPWITHLTNISWEMVRDKPTFRDICDQLLSVMEGRVFVAHNATFDWKFVSAEVERATGRRLEGQRLCTVRLARKLLPQLPRRSLDYVTAHYGIEIAARHRAAGDAVATAHVLIRLLRDARDRGIERWTDLERLLGARSVRTSRRRPSAMPQPVNRDTTA